MKNTYLFLAAAGIVLASCSNNDNVKVIEEKEFELGFSGAFVDNSTKATTGVYTKETLEKDGNTLGVFGYKVTTSQPKALVFDDQKVVYNDIRASKWGYTPLKYWDKGATKYQFYAYAPHEDDFTGSAALSDMDGTKFTITDFKQATSVAEQIDLLTDLTTQSSRTNFTNDVEFTFSHILSNVNFKMAVSADMKSDETDNPVTVVSVSLSEIQLGGNYAYNTTNSKYAWTITADAQKSVFSATQTSGNVFASKALPSIEATTGDKTKNVPAMVDMLMVPQTVSSTYALTIQYKIGDQVYDKTIALSEFKNSSDASLATWEPGYKYNYVLVIGPTPIQFGVTGVNDWSDGGTYTYTIQ